MNIFTLNNDQVKEIMQFVVELDKEIAAQVREVMESEEAIGLVWLEDKLREMVPHSFDPQMVYICRVLIRKCLMDYMVLLKSPNQLKNE